MVVGTALFTVAGIFFIPVNPVIGIIGVAFFGGGGFILARRMIQNRGAIALDRDGVHDLTTSSGVIPWEDIEYFAVTRDPAGPIGTKLIGARLRSYDRFIDSLSFAEIRRAEVAGRAVGFVGAAIAIAEPESADEAGELVDIPKDGMASLLAWNRKRNGFGLDVTWSPLSFGKPAAVILQELESYRLRTTPQ